MLSNMMFVLPSKSEAILSLGVRELATARFLATIGPFFFGILIICALCLCIRNLSSSNRCLCGGDRRRSSGRSNRRYAYARHYESRYFSSYGPNFQNFPSTIRSVKPKPSSHSAPYTGITGGENSGNCDHVCPICLEGCTERAPVIRLPCAHGLHAECLNQWFSKTFSPKCPLCRRELNSLCFTTWLQRSENRTYSIWYL